MVGAKLLCAVLLLAPPGLHAWSFGKVGNDGARDSLTLKGVGAGAFDPARMSNWLHDIRAPLIAPNPGGTCPGNIYAASAVDNGGAVNVFFGGWDGVSSCHDSVSVAVTADDWQTFGLHVPVVATGGEKHVNNPSALKLPDGSFAMLYTQLPNGSPPQNKPGFSTSADGVAWSPSAGGAAQAVGMSGYPGWGAADVNGGNVLVHSADKSQWHMYFVDFNNHSSSVLHAVADAAAGGGGAPPDFVYQGVAVQKPGKVVNDVKRINGHWLMGLHSNSQQTYASVVIADEHGGGGGGGGHSYNSSTGTGAGSDAPPSSWPDARVLFSHLNDADKYMVSIGFVVDQTSTVLRGAVYGAGAIPQLDNNRVFAAWLQRRAVFRSSDNATVWGVGDAARPRGPEAVELLTGAPSLVGNFYLYDSDYANASREGTLLAVSPTVTIAPGDVWEARE
jgi:hypothetical protein